jgi:exosortase
MTEAIKAENHETGTGGPVGMAAPMKGRAYLFLAFLAGAVVLFVTPMAALLRIAWKDNTISYIPLVPLVTAYLFYDERKEIFREGGQWRALGAVPLAVAILLYALWRHHGAIRSDSESLAIVALSFVLVLVGGLGLSYGITAWKAAAFPLVFLLFLVPIPSFLMERITHFLQARSTEVTSLFFDLTGVPVFRDGTRFYLPGIAIEVAKECSGIRSSISLLLVSLIAGHLFLRKTWRRAVLAASVVPIAIAKNAFRIVVLSLLGAYVDRDILSSVAHRKGGIPIFFLALAVLGCVLWLLRRGETKTMKALP